MATAYDFVCRTCQDERAGFYDLCATREEMGLLWERRHDLDILFKCGPPFDVKLHGHTVDPGFVEWARSHDRHDVCLRDDDGGVTPLPCRPERADIVQRLRELLPHTTCGHWTVTKKGFWQKLLVEAHENGTRYPARSRPTEVAELVQEAGWVTEAESEANGELIATVVNNLHGLLEEILRLRQRNTTLRRELSISNANNAERNRALDALHYVWCDGGCKGGVHRYCGSPDDITEEVVQTVERQAKRLRAWLTNRRAKGQNK